MINYKGLREEFDELIKAYKEKDYNKLVKVKEAVIRDNKEAYISYWIDPTVQEVTPKMQVVWGFHNLPDGHPQKVSVPITPPPVEHKEKDEVTKIANKFHDRFGTNEEFIKELKKRGIRWNVNSDSKINLMRAKMALKDAIKHGYDPFNSKKPPVVPEVKSKSPVVQAKETPVKMDMKTPTTPQADKVANDFLKNECGGDRNKFFEKIKAMGVRWTETKHEGTNFMFAKRMFKLAIDRGLDINNPVAQVIPTPTQKPKDESLLTVPENATEREKKLIEYINKMTDMEEIQGCARVGIVPEDNVAKSYILDTMQVRIALAVLNPDDEECFKDVDKNGNKRFPSELRAEIKKLWGEDTLKKLIGRVSFINSTGDIYDRDSTGFGKAVADQLILDGCKKSSITEGFKMAANLDMKMLVNPRSKILHYSKKGLQVADLLKSLNEGYADYTSDSSEYVTNLGYTGFSPEEYQQRYSLNNEGVVRYLNKIKTENPQLENKVNEMIGIYDETMKLVNHNPIALNLILSSKDWTDDPIDRTETYKLSNFGKELPQSYGEAVKAVKYADHLSDLVITELEKSGYSQQNILDALRNTKINDSLKNFKIKNDSGAYDTIDFTKFKNPDGTNAIVVRRFEHEWGSGMLAYTQSKYMTLRNIPLNSVDTDNQKAMKTARDFYNLSKQISEISEDTYKNVHKSALKMIGTKYIDKDGNDLDNSQFDVKGKSWKTAGIKRVRIDENPDTDLVLSNMIYGKVFHDVNSAVAKNVTNNAKGKMNDNGGDYSRNFNYYSGAVMKDSPVRYSQLGNTSATLTAQQLSSKIAEQTQQVPNISADYMSKLKTHYAMTGIDPALDSFSAGFGRATSAYLDSPIKDVLYQLAENVSLHTPITAEKPTFSKLTAKRLNYVPFDFKSKEQPRLVKEKVKPVTPPTPAEIKAARESLLSSAKCSLQSLDEVETREQWKKLIEEQLDYKKGEKAAINGTVMEPIHTVVGKDGKVDTTKSYDPDTDTFNQVVLLNKPLFKINNSLFEENFNARKQKMIDEGRPEECYTPITGFTGTSTWSAANIVGKDGKFYMKQEVLKTGQMLGAGPYFALKLGKACPYIGNVPYSNRSADVSRERADGVVMISKVMLGERYSKNATSADIKSAFKTFLGKEASDMDAIRRYAEEKKSGQKPSFNVIRDEELCGKDNSLIFPELLADTSSRVYELNIRYEDGVGYRDITTGELLYDTDGVSVNIKWK